MAPVAPRKPPNRQPRPDAERAADVLGQLRGSRDARELRLEPGPEGGDDRRSELHACGEPGFGGVAADRRLDGVELRDLAEVEAGAADPVAECRARSPAACKSRPVYRTAGGLRTWRRPPGRSAPPSAGRPERHVRGHAPERRRPSSGGKRLADGASRARATVPERCRAVRRHPRRSSPSRRSRTGRACSQARSPALSAAGASAGGRGCGWPSGILRPRSPSRPEAPSPMLPPSTPCATSTSSSGRLN